MPVSRASPEVAAALLHPGVGGPIEVSGARWLVTFRTIPHSQSWLVGIVVPEAYYTRDLRDLRDRFLLMTAALTVLAWVCYLQGEGVLAGIAIARARTADPQYSLAELLDQVLSVAVNPSLFHETIASAEFRRALEAG